MRNLTGAIQSRVDARREDARGAVALLLALVICFVLFPLGAFAVDIGMQRVVRADMQAIADVVALDMARKLANGTTPTDTLAHQSAQRSGGSLGRAPVVAVYRGTIAPGAAFVSDQSLGCGGAATAYNSYFTRASSVAAENAVLVTASATVDFAMTPGSGSACRSALAGIPTSSNPGGGNAATACYTVGSFAAAANTSNSALIDPLMRMLAQQSGAFSNSSAVMALSYQGLATSQVDLLRLAAGLGLGSINELATATVKIRDLYVAALGALVQPAGATNVAALNTLISTTTYSPAKANLGRIVGIGSGVGAGATGAINLLDLVGGSLAVVNGSNLASLSVGSSLPGIINANLQVKLIQGAHQFCGAVGDRATTATDSALSEQLRVTVTAQLAPGNATIALPGLPGLMGPATSVVALPNNVSTSVSVAPTSTTLTAVRCLGTPKGITVDVTNGLATLTVDTYLSNIVVNADILDVGVLGTTVNSKISVNTAVKVTATVSPSGVQSVTIDVPGQTYDTFYPSGSGGVGLGSPALTGPSIQVQSNVSILGLVSIGAPVSVSTGDTDRLLNAIVAGVVRPMFDSANPSSFVSTVVNPILGLLGTKVGGSYLSLSGSPPPTCEPKLVG